MVADSNTLDDNLIGLEQTLPHGSFRARTLGRCVNCCPIWEHRTYAKGEYIFHEGNEDTNMYIIERGTH